MIISIFRRLTLSIALAAVPCLTAADEAANAVDAWIRAVLSADPAQVEAILAPEFQIVRGSGARHDVGDYPTDGLPSIAADEIPEVQDILATAAGETMVVSYWLVIDVEADGHTLSRRAPRLTSFRQIDGMWKVSSHANFAIPTD